MLAMDAFCLGCEANADEMMDIYQGMLSTAFRHAHASWKNCLLCLSVSLSRECDAQSCLAYTNSKFSAHLTLLGKSVGNYLPLQLYQCSLQAPGQWWHQQKERFRN